MANTVKNDGLDKVKYDEDILVYVNGSLVKRHYHSIWCAGCTEFIDVRLVESGPKKGQLPGNAAHNKRKTHGKDCSSKLAGRPGKAKKKDQSKTDRKTDLPVIGDIWGRKPKKIRTVKTVLDVADLWLMGKKENEIEIRI